MGIIGVVAALTLPNLNSSTGDKEKVAKVKKLYSNLQDAYGRSVAIYGPYEEWSNNQKWGRITEFVKLSKDCGCSNSSNCFKMDGYNGSNTCGGILADGSSIYMDPTSTYFFVDIDGVNKGKNKMAYDIFSFYIDNNEGVLPEGSEKIKNGSMMSCDCLSIHSRGSLCTYWVVMYDNMDYLKADNNGKCPNGTQLTWENQTTCK